MLHPALPLVVAAALMAVLPRRAGQAVMLVAPGLAAAALVSLDPATPLTAVYFDLELTLVRPDRLAMAFGWVFVMAAFLAGLFGLTVMGRGERIAATAYAASALGVVFAGDLVTMFLFWELKAVTSTFLVWLRGTPRSAGAGMRYILVHVTGGTVLLGGIAWHIAVTGSTAFTAFGAHPSATLVLVGFALAAAIPPLHAWIADAYPEATLAGTVFLSAYTTKAAVYTLARGFPGTELLVWFGVAMALYGVVYAVLENDIRRLLVYHIVSQVGYMVAAVGIGTETAINGATAHAFAHILYKGLLLMGAGAVLYATGRSKLTELGGLARSMPAVATLYMVGAFSISAVPLFSGFVAKELTVEAASLEGRAAVEYLLKLASVGTFLHTGLKLPYFTWWGPDRRLDPAPVPFTMLAAMALAAAVNIAIGVYPAVLYDLLPFPVDYTPYSLGKVVETLQLLTFTAFGFWLLVRKLGGEPTVTLDTDWFYRAAPRLAADRLARSPVALRGLPRPAEQGARLVERLPKRLGALLPAAIVGSRPTHLPTWSLGLAVMGTFVVLLVIGLAR